jgi:hypothetical protein
MYVAVFYLRRRLSAQSFSSWEAAAGFLRAGHEQAHLFPAAIWQADSNRLWIWRAYSRRRVSWERALSDVRMALSLPGYHVFGTIEEFDDQA